jgi:hypothetical protein
MSIDVDPHPSVHRCDARSCYVVAVFPLLKFAHGLFGGNCAGRLLLELVCLEARKGKFWMRRPSAGDCMPAMIKVVSGDIQWIHGVLRPFRFRYCSILFLFRPYLVGKNFRFWVP